MTLGQVSQDDTIPLQHHYCPFQGRSFQTTPILSRKCLNFIRQRGFINASATCSSVLTHWSFMAPFCIISHMYKYRISRCFDLSWNTGFFDIFIQIQLSHRISVVSISRSKKPDISFRSHMASQLEEQVAMYSSLDVLREILSYFLLNHEIITDPRQNAST